MKLSIIAAIAKNRVIGDANKLPWHFSADLKHFRQITMGKPIVMGRKTYESLKDPLPGRSNIIISSNKNYQKEGCTVFSSPEAALHELQLCEEVMIIGGASLYNQLLPIANRLFLTLIHKDFEGDTFFPVIDFNQWLEVEREDYPIDPNLGFSFSFVVYERSSTA